MFGCPVGDLFEPGRLEDSFDKKQLERVALLLIESITYKIKAHHRSREDTTLDSMSQAVRNPVGF